MTGFEAYKLFLALKAHFTTDYDFFKYNKKLKASVAGFEKRKDKYKFEKLAKHKDLEDFLVSNFICDRTWIGDILSEEAEENFLEWQKRTQSLSYIFKQELEPYMVEFKTLFKVVKGQYPRIFILYKQGKISLETLVILDDILTLVSRWNTMIVDTVVWPIHRDRILKYRPFLHYDKKKITKILKEMVAAV